MSYMRKFRLAQKWMQKDAGQQLRISEHVYGRIERGEQKKFQFDFCARWEIYMIQI